MRYAILLIPLIALFALGCDDNGGEPSTTGLADSAGEVEIRDLLLRPEDGGPEEPAIGESEILTGAEFAQGFLDEQLQALPVTESEIAGWEVIAAAGQTFGDPETLTSETNIGVILSDSRSGAEASLRFQARLLERAAVEEIRISPGREVAEYERLDAEEEELAELGIGEDVRFVRYLDQDVEGFDRFDTYALVFRRERVVVGIEVRAPSGDVTSQTAAELASRVDSRVQIALGLEEVAEAMDAAGLLLQPEDVPAELGDLSEPLGEGPSSAVQLYNSPEQFPAQGAQYLNVQVHLRTTGDGAVASYRLTTTEEYKELEESIGEESRIVYYISAVPDDQVRLERYQLVFRRGRAVAYVEVTAPEGNVTLEQVIDLAEKLDGRIREGLE